MPESDPPHSIIHLLMIQPPRLDGHHIVLVPLSLDHIDDLALVGLDDDLWQWIPQGVRSRDDLRAYVESALAAAERGEAMPFAVIDRATGRAIGSTRYGNIDLDNRRVEIGWTWLGREWHRTGANTEMKYLLLRYAFDALECNRVELKTDALNARSRAAISRIGAKEEGTLRRHIVTSSGRVRDTVYYSIIREEWEEARVRLESMMESGARRP